MRRELLVSFCLLLASCQNNVSTLPAEAIGSTPEDTSPKQSPRLVPPETYLRTYLHLFGGLSPIAAQKALRGNDGSALFDGWNDYLSSLGLPDYRLDIPRVTQTNALMLTTFERLGIALCDRSLEHDWRSTPSVPVGSRYIFDFIPPAAADRASFQDGFDVLHRTFLGYPAALAPVERGDRFYGLFQSVVSRHSGTKPVPSRFTPQQAGWANVCYGLVRHPEFLLY